MIKVRFKRIKHGAHFNPGTLDVRFQEGSLERMPKKGEQMIFYHNRLGQDWWMTSPIKKVTKLKTVISVQTNNSIYHIKKGWK